MAFLKVENRAISSLASDVTDIATSWTLATGEGALFPTTGDFHVTCESEIAKCTARSTDVLTVVRAQEGTTAAAHITGKAVKLNITAGVIENVQTELTTHAGLTTGVHSFDKSCQVFRDVAQAIAHNTWTVPAFNSEAWDTDTMHDTVTNNSRLTCKTAGKYIITLKVTFAANNTGIRIALIRKNGSEGVAEHRLNAIQTYESAMSLGGIASLAVNDYVDTQVFQDSGGSLDISGLIFSMARIP